MEMLEMTVSGNYGGETLRRIRLLSLLVPGGGITKGRLTVIHPCSCFLSMYSDISSCVD